MRDRIIRFLSTENKTSAQFAEEIGVQPSGVSHILSGRNNPSLDFVMKMLKRYSFISPEWLLFGKEPMYRTTVNPTLFDTGHNPGFEGGNTSDAHLEKPESSVLPEASVTPPTVHGEVKGRHGFPTSREAERIVIFYSDRTFEEYEPGKK